MKIGFIGMGNMALAIAGGFIGSGKAKAEDIYAYAPSKEKLLKNSKDLGFIPCSDNREVCEKSDIVVIACKPYQIEDALSGLKDELKDKAIVSIAAGYLNKTYKDLLGDDKRILCIMPNTPAMVGEGVFLFEEGNTLKKEEYDCIYDLFSSIGVIETVPSELMGIGGAISGCGPAFVDLFMEAYADAAVKYGIKRDMAYSLIAQTVLGSAKLMQVTGEHPGVLKDAVCSPKGTTIRGVAALEEAGFRNACIKSVDAIMDYKKNG